MPLHRTGSASFSASPHGPVSTEHPAASPIRSNLGSVRSGMSHHSALGSVHNLEPPHLGVGSIRSGSASIRSRPGTMPSSPVRSAGALYNLDAGPGDGLPPTVNQTVTSPSLIRSRSINTSRAPSHVSRAPSNVSRPALGSVHGHSISGLSPRPSPMVHTSTLPPASQSNGGGLAGSIRSTSVRSLSLHSPSTTRPESLAPSRHHQTNTNIPIRQLHPSELHLARRNANDLGQLLIAIIQYVKTLRNQLKESKLKKKKKKEGNENEDLKSVLEDKIRLEREVGELVEGSVRASSSTAPSVINGGSTSKMVPPEIKVNVVRVVPSAREDLFIWEKEGYAGWKVRKVST